MQEKTVNCVYSVSMTSLPLFAQNNTSVKTANPNRISVNSHQDPSTLKMGVCPKQTSI